MEEQHESVKKKRCVTCAEPIDRRAKKCIHCESYQSGLLAYIPLSVTILSLLIALIAVATQIIPVVQSAWHQPEADVAYAVQTVDLRRMTVMAANDGDRSGAVSSGLLKINGNVRAGLRLMNGGGIVLLPPHSTAILNFIAEPNTPYDYRNREKDVCAIALPVTDQEGVRNFEDRTVDCEYLKVMLTAIRRAGGRQ